MVKGRRNKQFVLRVRTVETVISISIPILTDPPLSPFLPRQPHPPHPPQNFDEDLCTLRENARDKRCFLANEIAPILPNRFIPCSDSLSETYPLDVALHQLNPLLRDKHPVCEGSIPLLLQFGSRLPLGNLPLQRFPVVRQSHSSAAQGRMGMFRLCVTVAGARRLVGMIVPPSHATKRGSVSRGPCFHALGMFLFQSLDTAAEQGASSLA